MVNHPNRSAAGKQGREIAERIMAARAGRASVRLNGLVVQWDSVDEKKRLYIGDESVPVASIGRCLTSHEIWEIETLPRWDGGNEYQISSTTLEIVSAAISRYKGEDLACQCHECRRAREQYERSSANEFE